MNSQQRGLLSLPAIRAVMVFSLLLVLVLSGGVIVNKIRRDRQWATFKVEVCEVEIPAPLKAEIRILFEAKDPDGKQLRLAAEGIKNVMPDGIGSVLFVERENKLWKSAYGEPQRLPPNFKVGELGSWCDLWDAGQPVHHRFNSSLQAFIPLRGYPGRAAIFAIQYLRG